MPIGPAIIIANNEIIKVIVNGNQTDAWELLKSNVEPKIDLP
jgi:hypothetical protein